MPRTEILAFTVVLTLSPLVAPVAQQPDSVTADSTKAISRRRQPLPPISVTGTLSPAAADALGSSRTVLDASALRAEPARSAVDAIRNTTSVFIDEANGPLGPTIIRLRGGEETFAQILMDGVPVNENGGFFDAQGITLTNVDRVEVARGPQSTLYGSSALSGVVQMHTRAGTPGPLRMEATAEGGRTSTYGGSARASALASGGSERARFSFGVGSIRDRGQYRLPNDLQANEVSLRADIVPSDALTLTTVGRFLGVDAKLPVRNPGTTRAPLDPNQRQARDRVVGSLVGAWTPTARWAHQASVSYFRRDFTYEDTRDGLDQSQFSSFVFDFNYHYEAVVRRATARYVGTVSGTPLRRTDASLSYGGEWLRESLTDQQRGDFGPASTSMARPSVSGFGEGHARIGERLTILAGGRIERFEGLEAAIVPRAIAVLNVVPNRVALRASVSRAYKAPNIQDQFPSNPVIVANPDLEPETSQSWEAGTELRLPWMNGTAGVTYFYQDFENLIRSVSFDTTGRQINRNLGRSRAAGVEAELTLAPRARWSLGGSAAWMKTRIVDNGGLPAAQFPNGGELPFRPAYTATAFASAPVATSATVLMRVSAVGQQTVLTDRFRGARVDIAPYALLGATATWTMTPATDAYLQLANILGRKYDTAYDRPGMARGAAIGLRYSR